MNKHQLIQIHEFDNVAIAIDGLTAGMEVADRKSTRLNSSHWS